MAFNRVRKADGLVPVRNVIVSVFDKIGLADFAEGLARSCPRLRIYSTGGTFDFLAGVFGHRAGDLLVQISSYTGQPEMQGGLVKTLDWRIYLGLLSEPYNEAHAADRARTGSVAFDMVVGNLYPFAAASAVAGPFEDARQNVDIGGPCMLRAAAKNFLRVAPVCDPTEYGPVLDELDEEGGSLSFATRARLAARVFAATSAYDAAVAAFFAERAASAGPEYGSRGRLIPSFPDACLPRYNPVMNPKKLSAMYKEFSEDVFPESMEISFCDKAGKRSAIRYEKVEWMVGGERRGLRYGENPDQSAALFRPVHANLSLAGAELVEPEGKLVSTAELLQFGKHPGKTNLTDVDSALAILRYLADRPCCAIMKHNNPSGVAIADSLEEAYRKAYLADRVAAFGGAVVVNRPMDAATARLVTGEYCEVVAAPDFEEGALGILASRKNLRVMRLPEIARLSAYEAVRNLDFRTLLDGGCIVQLSFASIVTESGDFLPAEHEYQGKRYEVKREPTEAQYRDMLFGWFVECGVTSNSVIFVKDGVTVGIGTGEQDRVGVVEIARDKAYRKLEDRLCHERSGEAWNASRDGALKESIAEEVRALRGGIPGSVMVSDAFFPFRDGIDAGLREGAAAVVQPGGAMRDYESIEACNEAGATMKFTGQRCFRH